MNDYMKFRGQCKPMAEEAVRADRSLTLTRGYYHCPIWGKQAHWWATKKDGSIVDPSAAQFPSKGIGEYEPFNGCVKCSNCGKEMTENQATFDSNYAFCSYKCHGEFVGVL